MRRYTCARFHGTGAPAAAPGSGKNRRGGGKPHWELGNRIVKAEFTFVTTNRVDFIQLFGQMELHAGLVVIVPNVVPSVQRALFEGAIQYLAEEDFVNSAVEVSVEGKAVKCVKA